MNAKHKILPWIIVLLASLAFPAALSIFAAPSLQWPLNTEDAFILKTIRLPRYYLAFFTGAALSLSGAAFQTLLRNPLADPYILGISGGSALSYVLALIIGLPAAILPILGFLGAFASLWIILFLSQRQGVLKTENLLLTGIIFNSFSFAFILFLNAVSPFEQSQQILNLLIGAIKIHSLTKVFITGTGVLIAFFFLWSRSDPMNILSLGDQQAGSLGVNIKRERMIIFIVTSLLVGLAVSFCGLIGFIGLFIPHLTRLLFGANNQNVLPASAIFGGLFLLFSEFAAVHLFHWQALQTKLPVGAITAIIGAPLFVYLLKKQGVLK